MLHKTAVLLKRVLVQALGYVIQTVIQTEQMHIWVQIWKMMMRGAINHGSCL